MEFLERVKLFHLFLRRIQCYMKMADRYNKMRYAKLASEDCKFLGTNDLFDADMHGMKLLDLPWVDGSVENRMSLCYVFHRLSKETENFIAHRGADTLNSGDNRQHVC